MLNRYLELLIPGWLFSEPEPISDEISEENRDGGIFPSSHWEEEYAEYYNPNWRPTPWYVRIWNFIYGILYFISGPGFVVPVLGQV